MTRGGGGGLTRRCNNARKPLGPAQRLYDGVARALDLRWWHSSTEATGDGGTTRARPTRRIGAVVGGLGRADREHARYFAATDGNLSRLLFLGLCDAGVLVIDSAYYERVADRSASTFPMPPDIRRFVRDLSIASPGS
jgi:hypothetical protein